MTYEFETKYTEQRVDAQIKADTNDQPTRYSRFIQEEIDLGSAIQQDKAKLDQRHYYARLKFFLESAFGLRGFEEIQIHRANLARTRQRLKNHT